MTDSTPTDSPTSDTDSNKSFANFENPNYRKLYATLSVTAMMGCPRSDEDDSTVDMDTNNAEQRKLLADIASMRLRDSAAQDQGRHSLPPGWERHEDDNGPYFWHIPT